MNKDFLYDLKDICEAFDIILKSQLPEAAAKKKVLKEKSTLI